MRIVFAAILVLSPVAASAQQFICPGLMPQNITCEGGKTWNHRYQACE